MYLMEAIKKPEKLWLQTNIIIPLIRLLLQKNWKFPLSQNPKHIGLSLLFATKTVICCVFFAWTHIPILCSWDQPIHNWEKRVQPSWPTLSPGSFPSLQTWIALHCFLLYYLYLKQHNLLFSFPYLFPPNSGSSCIFLKLTPESRNQGRQEQVAQNMWQAPTLSSALFAHLLAAHQSSRSVPSSSAPGLSQAHFCQTAHHLLHQYFLKCPPHARPWLLC